MPAIPIIAALGTAAAGYAAIKGVSNAGKAADNAAAQPAPQVDIPALQALALQYAKENAATSAGLEQQYTPEVSALRRGSIEGLMQQLGMSRPGMDDITARIAGQAGAPVNAPLLQQAIERAQAELALGGQLPQDVQNAVTRKALAHAGTVGPGLTLGRDLVARDLGLTSLDLLNQRLSTATALGQAQAGLDTTARSNLFDSGNFLQGVQSGDFSRWLAASQLGQAIPTPMTGLDPSSIVNLAVGNTNAQAQKQAQNSALAVQAANGQTALGGSLAGAGLGLLGSYYASRTPTTYGTYTAPKTNYYASVPSVMCWVAREVYGESNPAWTEFRDHMVTHMNGDFVNFYATNGEQVAREISGKPVVKEFIRGLMDHIRRDI